LPTLFSPAASSDATLMPSLSPRLFAAAIFRHYAPLRHYADAIEFYFII